MDYKPVFGFLTAFVVLVIVLSLFTSIHQSALDNVNLRGLEAFETERYMAGTVYIYSQGEAFGRIGNLDNLCDEDPDLFRSNNLGFDLVDNCHNPHPSMSFVFISEMGDEDDAVFYSGEVGNR